MAPDAFFGLEDPKGRLYFFLEADRGTMTVPRFTRKIAAYATYLRDGRHRDKFGIKSFWVLTVTTGRRRREHLISAARDVDAVRGLEYHFLFTDEECISLEHPESFLGEIWTTPGDARPHRLLGPQSSSTTRKENQTYGQPDRR